jgi:hypothetical protein
MNSNKQKETDAVKETNIFGRIYISLQGQLGG